MPALITPETLHHEFPLLHQGETLISNTRKQVIDIYNNIDKRLVVIVGPCSIHDARAALEYAQKLQPLILKHQETLCILMRTYCEKARTNGGWKGLINDPHLDNTCDIEKGLYETRSLLHKISVLGVPVATEIVNPWIAPYFSDLLSWVAIGARTVESQIHRELASSLNLPVGFKNNTNGDIQVAIDAVQTAQQPHRFFALNPSGEMMIAESMGNPYCHLVLRGSHQTPNYDPDTIHNTINLLRSLNLTPRIMIDCSHGNSGKNPVQQMEVLETLTTRIAKGDPHLFGVMIESHLIAGKQAWVPGKTLRYGQSITDACIGWPETENALDALSRAVHIHQTHS